MDPCPDKVPTSANWLARAEAIATTLDILSLQQAGLARDRDRYFLNISYPSLQAMGSIHPKEIYPLGQDPQGGREMAVYIHIPFCRALCSYCHYYKVFGASQHTVDTYLKALDWELKMHRQNLGTITVASLYFGGGTPSYLSPTQIRHLFDSIQKYMDVPCDAEVSFEIHPENATGELFSTLRDVGVNRISIGVESLDDFVLKNEFRRHTSQDAINAYKMALTYGFENTNLDFIYGLRNQSPLSWGQTLETIGELSPPSFTAYYLRLKQGTPEQKLYLRNPSEFPSDHDLLVMHIMTFEAAADLGYSQDTVDWFIHDSKYFHKYQQHNWQLTDEIELLGVGASAYSYVNEHQYYNINDIKLYEERVNRGELPVWKGERLRTVEERMRRTLMLGLKSRIDRRAFLRIYGTDPVDIFGYKLSWLQRLGMIEITDDSLFLTYKGKLFADEVGRQFYSEEVKARMEVVDPTLISTTFPHLNPP